MVFVTIVVTALSSSQVLAQEPDNLDVRLFRLINSQQDPDRTGFFEILDHSSIPSFAALPLGFLIVGGIEGDGRDFRTGLMLAASEGLTFGSTSLLKVIVGRPRPFEALDNVRLKHVSSAGGRSFPSGHTSMAFSIATLISLQYRNVAVTIPLLAWASLIGYGRVYLGVHYPSDVLAGAILGTGVSVLVWQFRDLLPGTSEEAIKSTDPITAAARTGTRLGAQLVRIAIPLH